VPTSGDRDGRKPTRRLPRPDHAGGWDGWKAVKSPRSRDGGTASKADGRWINFGHRSPGELWADIGLSAIEALTKKADVMWRLVCWLLSHLWIVLVLVLVLDGGDAADVLPC